MHHATSQWLIFIRYVFPNIKKPYLFLSTKDYSIPKTDNSSKRYMELICGS